MTRYGCRAAAVVTLLCTVLVNSPLAWGHHEPQEGVDAKLYEVTENMALDHLAHPTLRTAIAALQGTARLGSPLCPVDLVHLLLDLGLLAKDDKPCTITAIGRDALNLETGAGTLTFTDGGFSLVINLDNPTDPAEFVVMTGKFEGTMQVLADTSVNPPRPLPLIAITGGTFAPVDILGVPIAQVDVLGLDPSKFGPVNFAGIFRLPFSVGRGGKRERARPSRDAFYLGDGGQLIKVRPDERSLGIPTVRVEINF